MRAGRLVRLRLEAADEGAARTALTEMCEELIANPVIEEYAIRLTGDTEDDAG